MIDDLVAQLVGDAGSLKRAATVLAVPLDSLTRGLSLVSRSSLDGAARVDPLLEKRRPLHPR
jgi:hypothetical protein